ncbi:hypothetical protein QN277_024012 [Acacia crassicarpa]|uniref:Uncharacterized protein n=1 Tax=Acacia crassicarpa TaxID=499986 RepID=A0AAE1JEC3_9FABA|nr:hypothetical protein QN277_024012 [Acacia crassicarpa]
MLLLTHSCRHFLEISIRLEYWMKRKFFLWERMSMLLARCYICKILKKIRRCGPSIRKESNLEESIRSMIEILQSDITWNDNLNALLKRKSGSLQWK